MGKVVVLVKPILLALLGSKEVKQLVVLLLEKYSKTTDNDVDDYVVDIVRKKLLG
jgi:hypothetical protein